MDIFGQQFGEFCVQLPRELYLGTLRQNVLLERCGLLTYRWPRNRVGGGGRVPTPMNFCLPPFQFHPGPQSIGRSFPHSGPSPSVAENTLTDTPRGCFGNLLGVSSQSSQVDSNHQTLVGVSRDKNRVCSLSLSLVTNYQYGLQGIPMSAGVIR